MKTEANFSPLRTICKFPDYLNLFKYRESATEFDDDQRASTAVATAHWIDKDPSRFIKDVRQVQRERPVYFMPRVRWKQSRSNAILW